MSEKGEQQDEILLEGDQTNNSNERIGFGTRFGAYMIDFLFVLIFGSIVGFLFGDQLAPLIFGKQMAEMDQFSGLMDGKLTIFFEKTMEIASGTSLIGMVLIILEGSIGQSIGKLLLKIINTNVDGTPASPTKLWTRALLKYGASILSLIGGFTGLYFIGTIGSLWSLVIFVGFFLVFLENKQTIHDMLAKTVVSRKK
jgi:uncharacterized RDD family membrane protein YckC